MLSYRAVWRSGENRVAWLLGLTVTVAAGLLSLSRIGDYDIWYHLRAGELILASGIPTTDPFSYTAGAQPASVQSWLAAVLFHLSYRVGGIGAVQIFNAAVVAATFGILFATTRLFARGPGDAWLSALLVLLAAFAARFRLGVRPHVLEYLFFALDLYVLQRHRVTGRAPLLVLPLVQLLWVNVHGSHILGLALPLLFLVAPGPAPRSDLPTEGAPGRGSRRRLALAATAAGCLVATLANPQGWRALEFPFRVAGMSKYMARIGEWQPITWDLLAGYGARYTWAFSLLLVLAVGALACTSAAARRLPLFEAGLLVGFAVLAFRGVRLIPEFAIAVVPGAFAGLAAVSTQLAARRVRTLAWGAAGCVALALPAAAYDRSYDMGLGVKERIFPGRALAFAEENGIAGRVFNSFAFGDWLTFHAPHRPVYIHGRNEVFPEAFYEEFRAAHRDPAVFERVVARYGIEWILLEYELTDHNRAEEMPHLLGDPRWVPVYWDRVSAVFVRRDGPNGALAERAGFAHIRPARLDFAYLEGIVARGQAGAAIAEFERLLRLAPSNDEAALGQAYVLNAMGASAQLRAALERALAVNPSRAMTHSALGLLALARRDLATARGHLDRALALDPNDPGAIEGLGRLGVRVARATPPGHP